MHDPSLGQCRPVDQARTVPVALQVRGRDQNCVDRDADTRQSLVHLRRHVPAISAIGDNEQVGERCRGYPAARRRFVCSIRPPAAIMERTAGLNGENR